MNLPDLFFQDNPTARALGGDSIFTVTSKLLPNIIMIAGITAIFYAVIWVGWNVITTAGEDTKAKLSEQARLAMTYGLIGFLLVVSAYFILQIVGKVFGINFITPNLP